jgi:hypothetical protein
LKNYRAALERIARGNRPEVEAKREGSIERAQDKIREIKRCRGA